MPSVSNKKRGSSELSYPLHRENSAGHHHSGHFHGADGAPNQVPAALFRAIAVTVVFMGIELVGGYLSNSLALITDAAHMLTDVGAMLLSLFAYWMARRPSTPTMSFGYHRVEILGALTSGLVIWLIAGFLIYEAILRLSAPPDVKGPLVFVVATVGLAANLVSMRILHRARDQSINVRAAYLHVLADSLGSIGAVIAGAVIWLTQWMMIDLIVTFVFSALMLVSSWGLVKESVGVLMESAPSHLNPANVRNILLGIPGVEDVHDLHIWSVSSGRPALSVHLISRESEQILSRAHAVLKEKFGIIHTTIQVEHPDRFSAERCYDCVPG